jgi:hypothetical protein
MARVLKVLSTQMPCVPRRAIRISKEVSKMKIEEIRVRDRIRMRGLKNKGLIEISQDPKTGDFVLIVGKGIHKRWLLFNFPEGMWRAECSRKEVLDVVKDFLTEKVLKD